MANGTIEINIFVMKFSICGFCFMRRHIHPWHKSQRWFALSVCFIVTITDLIEFTESASVRLKNRKQAPSMTMASTWESPFLAFFYPSSGKILFICTIFSVFFVVVIQYNSYFSVCFLFIVMVKSDEKKHMWWGWGWVLNESFNWKRYLAYLIWCAFFLSLPPSSTLASFSGHLHISLAVQSTDSRTMNP